MGEFNKKLVKDIGLQREVEEALPYAVVGGAWEASFERALYGKEGDPDILTNYYRTVLNHVVPTGQQLKILFLRVFTQEAGGARFGIYQTNFGDERGTTGTMDLDAGTYSGGVDSSSTVEPYPQVGSVPSAWRDYPKLEAAGAEVLRGSLVDPVHVIEGSVDFRVLSQYPGAPAQAQAGVATGSQYSVVWWGVEKTPE